LFRISPRLMLTCSISNEVIEPSTCGIKEQSEEAPVS
jgi:hypothetical protein